MSVSDLSASLEFAHEQGDKEYPYYFSAPPLVKAPSPKPAPLPPRRKRVPRILLEASPTTCDKASGASEAAGRDRDAQTGDLGTPAAQGQDAGSVNITSSDAKDSRRTCPRCSRSIHSGSSPSSLSRSSFCAVISDAPTLVQTPLTPLTSVHAAEPTELQIPVDQGPRRQFDEDMGRGILDLRKRLAEGLRSNSTKSKQPSAPAPATSNHSHTATLELANAAVVLRESPAAIHVRDYTLPPGQHVVPPPSAASSAASKRAKISPPVVVSASTTIPPLLPTKHTSLPPLLPSSKRPSVPPQPLAAAQIKAALATPQQPIAVRVPSINSTLGQLVGPRPTDSRSSHSSSGATSRPSPGVPTLMTPDQSRSTSRTSAMSTLTSLGSSMPRPPIRPSSAAVRPSSATAAPVIMRPTSVPAAHASFRPQSILMSRPVQMHRLDRPSHSLQRSYHPPKLRLLHLLHHQYILAPQCRIRALRACPLCNQCREPWRPNSHHHRPPRTSPHARA
ncbi:hypothetical protein BKA62DRAFT_413568 [Auriculariales sp. MPI-PUGE-AT-0066]|nr:hypothetical protein BKA62DRAFT_413568 [Auriculariales sp. MPI-PUGE-AT-0066]